jgi:type V secretory pathway adhesin AidA
MRHRVLFIFPTSRLMAGTALASGAILFLPGLAHAACGFVPTPGNDTFICDSGTSVGGLTDPGGDNLLLMPAGGTGRIDGDVSFAGGVDTIEIHSGTIAGTVDQGAGADAFVISDGVVTGNVQQGGGVDDFRMEGGQIGSLNQGDALDTFFMSDGRIVDFFDDGDRAFMTGGRIGRVNMKLDNNLFDMSGGVIDKNLVTGFGNDTIILSNGTIGGNISVSGGTDSVTVTGGTVGGEVRMSVGNDSFTWNGGGILYGLVDLGGDDDTASLTNLTDANIGATPQISGGAGTDALRFDNVKTGDVARFDSWESIGLTNDSQLVFDGTLKLGDTGTGTGVLNVDATSTLCSGAANGGIASFTPGQLASVVNSGRIDLTNGGGSTSDTFTVSGTYTGNGGEILLDTVLGDDSSASDKLVIDGGTASGTTGMSIFNAGGAGANTTQNGIMVVQAVNGGTTGPGNAFALNNRVAAGAFEYYLFKGGISDGTAENWYLRSTLVTSPTTQPAPAPDPVEPAVAQEPPEEPVVVAPPPPSELPPVALPSEGTAATDPVDSTPPVTVTDLEPEAPPAPPPAPPATDLSPPTPPTEAAPVPIPNKGVAPPTPGATPVIADVVPLYRVEVPAYSVVLPAAHHLALSTLGTFHERRGEQALLNGAGYLPASWGRIFGQDAEMKWGGTADPSYDGNLFGFQAGQDIFGRISEDGSSDRFGLFVGYSHMDGDIKGQALGWNDLAVGDLDLAGTSFGGYWTHIGPSGWYLDGVLMGTWFDGHASSNSGQNIGIDGTAVTASLEGGYPIMLSDRWTLEPQGQIIWNRMSLDDRSDAFSSVSFDSDDAVRGRIGLRLQGNFETAAGTLQPYLKANLWRNFSADQTVRFDADPIVTDLEGTSLELGAGIVAKLSEKISLFATADYTTNIGAEKTRILEGNTGLSIKW